MILQERTRTKHVLQYQESSAIYEENENKYLIRDLTDNNKEVPDTYKKLWSEIKKNKLRQ